MKLSAIILIFFQVVCFASSSVLTGWSEAENCTMLNSNSDDFAPYWSNFDQKLYFTSSRNKLDYFYIADKDSFCFGLPKLIKSGINTDGENRSYFFQISETEAYISAFKMINGKSYLNVFRTEYYRNSWVEPSPILELESESFSGHATVSEDGENIIFASSRGNFGADSDLWMAFKDLDNKWTSPVKLDELNSPEHEISPRFVGNDTLFFASNGLGGKGGFDIYMSARVLGRWTRPRPIHEINTEFNESDFTFIDANSAVFASDRPNGKGGLDIYITQKNNLTEQKNDIDFEDTEIAISSQVLNVNIINYQNYIVCDYPDNIKELNLNDKFPIDSMLINSIRSENGIVEFISDSIYISPTVLAIGVAIRPEENIREWTCSISGNETFIENQKGKEPDANILFKLNNYIRTVANSDSIIVILDLKSKLQNNIYKSLKISVDKSIVKVPQFKEENNSKYEILYFWKNDLNLSPDIIDYFAKTAAYSKQITLEYIGNKQDALKLKLNLENKIKNREIKLKKIEYNFNLPFSKEISENILILKINKL